MVLHYWVTFRKQPVVGRCPTSPLLSRFKTFAQFEFVRTLPPVLAKLLSHPKDLFFLFLCFLFLARSVLTAIYFLISSKRAYLKCLEMFVKECYKGALGALDQKRREMRSSLICFTEWRNGKFRRPNVGFTGTLYLLCCKVDFHISFSST